MFYSHMLLIKVGQGGKHRCGDEIKGEWMCIKKNITFVRKLIIRCEEKSLMHISSDILKF